MAVVVPLMAVYSGVTAGMAMAAGAAVTFTGAMAVAGGMLAGVGLLANNKDFQRMGSIASAISGAAGAFSSLSGGGQAAAGAGDAFSVGEFGEGVTPVAKDGFGGAAEGAGLGDGAVSFGAEAAGQAGGVAQAGGIAEAANAAPQFGQGLQELPTAFNPMDASMSFKAPSLLEQAASGMTKADLLASENSAAQKTAGKSIMDRSVGENFDALTNWVKNNKEVVKLGTDALSGAYGPEAEMVKLRKQQQDAQMSLMERARVNSNTPIALKYQPRP